MFKFQEGSPFRSDRWRKLAAECPKCMHCGKANDGSVVGAHSNLIKHGHGTGQKAHDVLAFLCYKCHAIVDGRDGKDYTPDERLAIFYEALYSSIVWMLKNDHLEVR